MEGLFALSLALMLHVFCARALPAQADGTATTVMMYMCGTDLQSAQLDYNPLVYCAHVLPPRRLSASPASIFCRLYGLCK